MHAFNGNKHALFHPHMRPQVCGKQLHWHCDDCLTFHRILVCDHSLQLFLKPIRVGGLLPQDVTADIFSNIEAILSVNKELFSCMRQHSLGEAFTYLGPFLKLYSTYANNFQNATSVLQDYLQNSEEFSGFVSLQEARPECCGLRLSSLLITPVQRIPR